MSRVNSLKQLMTLHPQHSCQLDPRIAIGDPLVFAASCSGLASTRGLCVFLCRAAPLPTKAGMVQTDSEEQSNKDKKETKTKWKNKRDNKNKCKTHVVESKRMKTDRKILFVWLACLYWEVFCLLCVFLLSGCLDLTMLLVPMIPVFCKPNWSALWTWLGLQFTVVNLSRERFDLWAELIVDSAMKTNRKSLVGWLFYTRGCPTSFYRDSNKPWFQGPQMPGWLMVQIDVFLLQASSSRTSSLNTTWICDWAPLCLDGHTMVGRLCGFGDLWVNSGVILLMDTLSDYHQWVWETIPWMDQTSWRAKKCDPSVDKTASWWSRSENMTFFHTFTRATKKNTRLIELCIRDESYLV